MRRFHASFTGLSLFFVLLVLLVAPAQADPLPEEFLYSVDASGEAMVSLPYNEYRRIESDSEALIVEFPDATLEDTDAARTPIIHTFDSGPLLYTVLRNGEQPVEAEFWYFSNYRPEVRTDGQGLSIRFTEVATVDTEGSPSGPSRSKGNRDVRASVSPDTEPSVKLNFNFKSTPIRDVLRAIAAKGDINLVTDDNVTGNVTLRLREVPPKVALDAILRPRGYTYERRDGVYYVQSADGQSEQAHENRIERTDGKLLLDVKDYPLQKLLKELSAQTDYTVFFPSDLTGSVNLFLDKLAPEKAIKNLLISQNLAYSQDEKIFRVVPSGQQEEVQPHFDLTVDTETASLNVAQADLRKLLDDFFQKADLDSLIFGEVRGQVNARIQNIPIHDLVPTLLEGTEFTYDRRNGIYIIGQESAQGDPAKALLHTDLYNLKHIKASEAKTLLPSYIPQSTVNVLEGQNALSISSSKKVIDRFNTFLNKIDKPSTVVMIKALVVDYSTDFSEDFNFSGTFSGGDNELTLEPGQVSTTLRFGEIDLGQEFTGNLQALINEGKANVKARPKVASLSGKSASIKVATEEFFRVTTGNVETPLTQLEKIESGVKLNITPWASEQSGKILMDIQAEVSSPGQVNAEGLPAINTRETQTNLTVPNGKTIVIGGLIQDRETTNREQFPILGNIPVLGYFFSSTLESESKNELIFYITPEIIHNYENYEKDDTTLDTAPITGNSELKR